MANTATAKDIRQSGYNRVADTPECISLADRGLPTISRKHYQANPDSPIFEELCSITRKIHVLQ